MDDGLVGADPAVLVNIIGQGGILVLGVQVVTGDVGPKGILSFFSSPVEWPPGTGQFQAADLTGLRDCSSLKQSGPMFPPVHRDAELPTSGSGKPQSPDRSRRAGRSDTSGLLRQAERWDEPAIRARAARFADLAVDIWRCPVSDAGM